MCSSYCWYSVAPMCTWLFSCAVLDDVMSQNELTTIQTEHVGVLFSYCSVFEWLSCWASKITSHHLKCRLFWYSDPHCILILSMFVLPFTDMKSVRGGPDPTLGGAASEQTSWCLDAKNLKDNIKKILIKFCVPAPIVFRWVQVLCTASCFSFLLVQLVFENQTSHGSLLVIRS